MYSSSCPQASILCLHNEPGEAVPTEFFKGEDAIDFVPVRVQSAPRNGGKCPVDEGAEDAVLVGGLGSTSSP
jgi:hypothetical protein